MGKVNGRDLIFFCGGNGIVYAFEPLAGKEGEGRGADGAGASVRTLKRVFQFDFDPSAPKPEVHKFNRNRQQGPSILHGMPVFHDGRLFVAGGGDLWWGKNEAWLKCIDPRRTGDITTNGLVWSYPLQKHVLGTPAIVDGLAFIADCGRTFHCVDAKTGKGLWTHEIDGEVWASPLVADGKVYLGTRTGTVYILAAAKQKKVFSEVELVEPISATATAANGVIYVATMSKLFAIKDRANSAVLK
jgi:outer membrane protein assembly factor BamB